MHVCPWQPSANARKGNRLYRVTPEQYTALRDHWPANWRDALPADVAAQIGAPAALCKPRKQEEQGPLFFTRISCKQTYDLAWRRSVCAHFGLTPSVM